MAKVEVAPAPPGPAAPDVTASVHEAAAPPIASADQVEAASGVKVTRPGGGGPPNARIIDVERALADRLNAAPDPRLVETSRYGPLPRVGADGARPFEVYARPVLLDPKLKAGAPRIALMVGGPRPQRRGRRSGDRQTAGRGDAWVCALWRGNRGARGGSAGGGARDRAAGADGGLFEWDRRAGAPYAEDVSLRRRQSRFAALAHEPVRRLCCGGQSPRRQIHRRYEGVNAGSDGNRSPGPRLSRRRRFAAQRRAGRRRGAGDAVGARGCGHRRQPDARGDRSGAGAAPRSRPRARLGDRRRLGVADERRAFGPMDEWARIEGRRSGPAFCLDGVPPSAQTNP